MSTMSASSLALPSLPEDDPVQKRSDQLPATGTEAEALQFPTTHKDPPFQPQDLAQEDIDVPLEEKALLNVEVSGRMSKLCGCFYDMESLCKRSSTALLFLRSFDSPFC